jgi:Na+/melibiose symporter-like transporter
MDLYLIYIRYTYFKQTRGSTKIGRVTAAAIDPQSNQKGSTKSGISSFFRSNGKRKERMEREQIPEMNLSDNVVGWDGQDDPNMPLNFVEHRRWFLLILTSAMTMMVALASSMIAPGVTYIDAELHNTSTILGSMTVTIFLLGFAVGPILLSPLSEIYGRKIVLTGGNIFFIIWQIGCALSPNVGSLIVFRFLAGVGGSASLTIGGGLISDLFYIDQRGTASSMYETDLFRIP